ncbi:MAG: sodium:proton antiporter, partial [Blautia sp.]|nr:sodium:proton antiporter [Blautia sp.]
VIGGLVLLMGLLLLYDAAGTLTFAKLSEAVGASEKPGRVLAASLCILVGFGCKAGMFPVHVWLPKAHPVAPSPASALLSGILTKVGIYGILMTSMACMMGNIPYGVVVLTLGAITMFLGAVLALFSVNLKRTLACSSMSQVGFILTGLGTAILSFGGEGEGYALAHAGLTMHMVNHSLIKLTLFMAAGVVVMNLGTLTLNDIRGYGRNKPFLKIAFALGALGISGVPFFNGYMSKTLLHEGIVEAAELFGGNLNTYFHVVEWVFLISGGFTFAYMLKLFICIFVEKNKDAALRKKYAGEKRCMNKVSTGCIFGSSLLMVLLGNPLILRPLAVIMSQEEHVADFLPFTIENLKGGGISLGIGALLYLIVVRFVLMREGRYVDLWPKKLDLEDLVYRPLLTDILPEYFGGLLSVFGENKVFTPLARFLMPERLPALMSLFGENKILTPLAGTAMGFFTFLGRALTDSLDGMILLLSRTVMREKKVLKSEDIKETWYLRLQEELKDSYGPLMQNFSFALMMTCIGMLIILIALMVRIA